MADSPVEIIAGFIANNLYSLYQKSLDAMTQRELDVIADGFSRVILWALKKQKIESLDDLLHEAILHDLVLQYRETFPKLNLAKRDLYDEQTRNMRHTLSRAPIYCKEEDTVYVKKADEVEKYNVVLFEDLEELKSFKDLPYEKAHFEYQKLSTAEKNVLLQGVHFRSEPSSLEEQDDEIDDAGVNERRKDMSLRRSG